MNAALHDDLLRSIQDTVSCPSIWSQSAPSIKLQYSSRGKRISQIWRMRSRVTDMTRKAADLSGTI